MGSHVHVALFVAVLSFAAGCSPRPPSTRGDPAAQDAPAPLRPALRPRDEGGGGSGGGGSGGGSAGGPVTLPVRGEPARFLAARADGAIVLADVATGAVLASSGPDGREVRDLAFDAANGRVLAALFEDADAGELLGLPLALAAPAFGDPVHDVWVDGDLRVLPTGAGVLSFQLGYAAERWWWSAGGELVLPPPRSAWLEDAGPGAVRLEALTYGDPASPPALVRQAAVAGPAGLVAEPPEVLPLDAGADPTARLVGVPAVGDAMLVDAAGEVVLRQVAGGAVGGPVAVPGAPTAGRIEAAVALDGGRVVVALTNLPARLVAVGIGDSGAIVSGAVVDLPAVVGVADRFFSRDLAVVSPHRLLVATAAGVLAFDVASASDQVTLSADPVFDGGALRGPLGCLP